MDGIYLLNKEINDTSMFVVNKVKGLLKLKKAGHTGTLDPFASGLILVCANNATKSAQIFQNLPKTYEALFIFGEEKDTDDLTGKTVQTSDKIPSLKEIEEVLPYFTGKIEQIPPQYSAVWVDGVRAFNLKRSSQDVELNLKSKNIEIFEYQIISYHQNELKVRVNCSSGSYIRALARDLGRILNSFAYVKELKRLTIGNFKLPDAKIYSQIQDSDMIPLNTALSFLPSFELKKEYIINVSNAVPLKNDFFIDSFPDLSKDYYYKVLKPNQKLLAILKGQKYYYINKEDL